MNKAMVWIDGLSVIRDELPEDVPDRTGYLETWRSKAHCSRMQGILALGEANWTTIQDYKATATWAEGTVIDEAGTWFRNSQDIAFFAYLLNLSDLEVDDLFRLAVTIET